MPCDAFTIMTAEDSNHVDAIERFIGRKIERLKLENFDYRYTVIFDEAKGTTHSDRRVRGGRIHGGYSFGPARRRR